MAAHNITKQPAGSSMERSETIREQVSALVDGDIEPDGLRASMSQLREGEGRHAWDLYHQIGDAIRSAEPAPAMRRDFAARFAERFATEPLLLQPRRSLLSRLQHWPTTMAAVAAALFGFVVAPSLMRDSLPSGQPFASTAQVTAAVKATPTTAGATAGSTAAAASADDKLDYIALHHSAHPSLYGATPAIRPAVLDTASRP